MVGTDLIAKAALDAIPAVMAPPKSRDLSPRDYLLSLSPEALGDEHPGADGMHYGLLNEMSKVPVVAAIHQTRIGQVVDFAGETDDPHRNGWRLGMRDKRKAPSSAARKSLEVLSKIITRAGKEYQPVSSGFEGFLAAIVRDSLTYDQANFEVLFAKHTKNARTERGRLPVGFVYVDPSTIRRAKPSKKEIEVGRLDPTVQPAFVQILEDRVREEYTSRDMAFCVRTPRSSVNSRGYGRPELEILIGVVANLLKADTWNSKKFTTGIRSDQIITINSDMSSEMFSAVRRIVWAMLSGTSNNQRLPMLQLSPDLKEELKVHPLGHSATDMQFREWINFLIKQACAMYQMDPAELGFVFGNEGQTNSMNSQGPAERIAASQERGLHPLLRSIAGWLNEMIVWQWDPDFEFKFTGYDDYTAEERQELDIKAAAVFRTPNELRANRDEKPLVLMAGKVNLFDLPQHDSIINAAVQMSQMGGEGEGFGDEFDGNDDGNGNQVEESGDGTPKGTEEPDETEKGGLVYKAALKSVKVRGLDNMVGWTADRYKELTTPAGARGF